jgi:hypothetical protein
MQEHWFTGMTQAGRELVLFYEHTSFRRIETDDGPYDDPTETKVTATLDGKPIEVTHVNFQGGGDSGGDAVTVQSELGTFSAVAGDREHGEALRRYREMRPSGGWAVSLKSSIFEDETWKFVLAVTNDRVAEDVEVHMSDQVAKSWTGDGTSPPPEDMIVENTFMTFRHAKWEDVVKASEHPTTVLAGRRQR